jgi:hypothetical protein
MNRIILRHLTFVGERVEPAGVDFAEGLTLVLGPSDTGKSFIVGALDFMLGAKALPEIPELEGYRTLLMGLSRGDEDVTLARSTSGGRFSVYDGLLKLEPPVPPEQTLAASHSGKSDENISSFLLDVLGLNGREVQKNQRSETDSLSFRDIARLAIVDETKMQSTVRPAMSGNNTTVSKETSVLRLLLQDEDDTSTSVPTSKPTSKVAAKAKIEVYDKLLADLEVDIAEAPTATELEAQQDRLVASLTDATQSMQELRDERDRLARSRLEVQEQEEATTHEITEAGELLARFALLRRQYESDLRRLEALAEAGSLLGYFAQGPCPFCGAEEEYQHLNAACDGDETFLAASVESERARTQSLLDDLVATLEALTARRAHLLVFVSDLRSSIGYAEQQMAAIEDRMSPLGVELREIVDAKSMVDKRRELVRRRDELEEARAFLVGETASDAGKVSAKMQHRVLADFSGEIQARLSAWGVPEVADVRYDRAQQDIFQGNQFREAHGKGLRSVLHAAFTVALARFCIERDLPHPGFIVLDSPIVTYRPPDFDGEEGEGAVPAEFATAFYADLLAFPGQVIVMENVEPPTSLAGEGVAMHLFSKSAVLGRYGFFSHAEAEGLGGDGDGDGDTEQPSD